MIKLSIIIPVYNVQNFLPLTLNAVLNQSYQNLEIILIDDGSTDTSLSICEEYAKKDVRIKVFHQENKGVSVARNIGLSLATGKYIGFVDSDDMPHPDMFAKLLGDMLCFDVDLAICDTAFINVDATEIPDRDTDNKCTEKYISIKTSLLDILWGDNERSGQGFRHRRKRREADILAVDDLIQKSDTEQEDNYGLPFL